MILTKALVLTGPLRWAAAGLLGLGVLWWVVEHAGAPDGTAIVHVCEPGVDVRVGDRTYRVEDPFASPLICKLPAGRHELRMSRGGRVLYREDFLVRRGEHVILAAWVPPRGPTPASIPAPVPGRRR